MRRTARRTLAARLVAAALTLPWVPASLLAGEGAWLRETFAGDPLWIEATPNFRAAPLPPSLPFVSGATAWAGSADGLTAAAIYRLPGDILSFEADAVSLAASPGEVRAYLSRDGKRFERVDPVQFHQPLAAGWLAIVRRQESVEPGYRFLRLEVAPNAPLAPLGLTSVWIEFDEDESGLWLRDGFGREPLWADASEGTRLLVPPAGAGAEPGSRWAAAMGDDDGWLLYATPGDILSFEIDIRSRADDPFALEIRLSSDGVDSQPATWESVAMDSAEGWLHRVLRSTGPVPAGQRALEIRLPSGQDRFVSEVWIRFSEDFASPKIVPLARPVELSTALASGEEADLLPSFEWSVPEADPIEVFAVEDPFADALTEALSLLGALTVPEPAEVEEAVAPELMIEPPAPLLEPLPVEETSVRESVPDFAAALDQALALLGLLNLETESPALAEEPITEPTPAAAEAAIEVIAEPQVDYPVEPAPAAIALRPKAEVDSIDLPAPKPAPAPKRSAGPRRHIGPRSK
jgi:hypothetical protein